MNLRSLHFRHFQFLHFRPVQTLALSQKNRYLHRINVDFVDENFQTNSYDTQEISNRPIYEKICRRISLFSVIGPKKSENAVKIGFSAALSQRLHIETPTAEHQKRAATKSLTSHSNFFRNDTVMNLIIR